ncbi:MAG: hypothetical protein EGR73_02050, partial [Lachnospiraceae bacterium]|nr:hypothetical protein [Lachnospiraceae bacterium]
HFTALSAFSFMVFVLLYTPCISVIGTMKKEFGNKMCAFSVIYQVLLAWIASFAVYNIGSLIIYNKSYIEIFITALLLISAIFILYRSSKNNSCKNCKNQVRLINLLRQEGQVISIFPFPLGTRIFCLQCGQR